MEVEDSKAVPIKRMRYPVDNGELYQDKIRERRTRLMEVLQCDYDRAEEIAEMEFAHFMATTPDLVSDDDPGNSTELLKRFDCNDEMFIQESKQFYQNCETVLVQQIPMKTYQKMRYSSGVNLDLLKRSELPELKDYWTINTNRLTNIASQVNVKGCYSQEEEFLEHQREKAMFKCANEYGVMANVQFENFDFLQKAVRTNRSFKARNSEESSAQIQPTRVNEEIVLGSDVASTTHGKGKKVKIKLM